MNAPNTDLPEPYADADLRRVVAQYGSPLLLVDCARLRRLYRRLSASLPGVEIYCALKALSDPAIVRTLHEEGSGFDLATTGELDLVLEHGVDPCRCIHTHPVKRERDIAAAVTRGVRLFVADSVYELPKFVPFRERCEVLIRVAFPSPEAIVDLSAKFGCAPSEVPMLLDRAAHDQVRIAGFATHAGSQPRTPAAHLRAITGLIELLAQHRAQLRGERPVLDIGGGFPTEYGYGAGAPAIEAFCAPLRAALAQVPPSTRVLCEPGRYLIAPVGTALASVVGKAERRGRWWYYLDDGIYGSWSGQLHEAVRYPIRVLGRDGPRFRSVLAGPTCDGIDVIAADIELPRLECGDLIVGETMGAYTAASASDFNRVPRARILPVNEGPLP